jgi:hypothetical protein
VREANVLLHTLNSADINLSQIHALR